MKSVSISLKEIEGCFEQWRAECPQQGAPLHRSLPTYRNRDMQPRWVHETAQVPSSRAHQVSHLQNVYSGVLARGERNDACGRVAEDVQLRDFVLYGGHYATGGCDNGFAGSKVTAFVFGWVNTRFSTMRMHVPLSHEVHGGPRSGN
jgi:hypothetical protein